MVSEGRYLHRILESGNNGVQGFANRAEFGHQYLKSSIAFVGFGLTYRFSFFDSLGIGAIGCGLGAFIRPGGH